LNPLLQDHGLPAFDRIAPEHVADAVSTLLDAAQRSLDAVCADAFAADWTAVSATLDVATERLSVAWGTVSHLNSVADTPALRAAYNAALPQVTEFWTRLGANEKLYAKYKAMDPEALNAEQLQARAHALRDFVLGGAELRGPARQRYAEIQERQAELGQKFSENTLDATDAFAYFAQAQELEGVPPDIVQAARNAAQAEGREGYKLTLQAPCYFPVMQFARSSALRATLYRAYQTRASDQAAAEFQRFDNGALLREILALRREEAQLLGYADYGSLSLATKMADSSATVLAFLRQLAERARPYALQDLADMRAFAAQELQLDDPQAWDWAYVGERLKEARYAYSEQDVKCYFTAPRVLAGLFGLVESLYQVRIVADQAAVWNDSVQFFRIERSGELLGQFYLDQNARAGKRGGAWMDDVRTRWLRPDTGALQTPVAHLVCNFAAGVDGQAALLTHDDVITLFHEFGHGLHHLLTQVNERQVAGISGVEWDAVELPSQFMENFCWEWPVLQALSSHVTDGTPLPRALYDKMHRARNFQSGLQTLRQVEFALLDMLLHTAHDPQNDILPLLQQVRDEVAVIQPPPWARSVNTFSHIFAGGYAAGYYSYKWAEVLSADAYAAFEEAAGPDGAPDAATGKKFRECILEVGGSRPAMASFEAFRGRAPTLDALLRHQGMVP